MASRRTAIELVAAVLGAQSRKGGRIAPDVRKALLETIAEGLDLGDEAQVDPVADVPEGYREGQPDPKVEEAKPLLLELFTRHPDEVFYATQVEVRFERQFFHWVSSAALNELVDEGKLASEIIPLWPPEPKPELRFFWLPRLRYWLRKAKARRQLVQRFSQPTFGHALGDQGEMIFDAALGGAGFAVAAKHLKEWKDRSWRESSHNLDRVYARDGFEYGTEIKNALGYIQPKEFQAKLAMALSLRLTPLFICRAMPKTYINTVVVLVGFCLIFGYQMYPFGHEALAEEVTKTLGLPIGRRIEDGTTARFVTWHEQRRPKQAEGA